MKMLPFIAVVALGSLSALGKEYPSPIFDWSVVESPRVMLDKYFEGRVRAIEGQLEREVKSKEDWLAKKGEYRRQLAEMLGLDPMPARTDLKATVTGQVE